MRGSLTAYAKHRKGQGLIGGSLMAVQKARDSKRIQVGTDGLIDFERADHDWEQNSNHRQRRRPVKSGSSAKPEGAKPEIPPPPDGPPPDDGELPNGGTFLEAQRQREWERVWKDRDERRRRRGELVELAPINAFVAGMIMKARDELLRIGPELRDRMAQETDPITCEELMVDRLSKALGALAEYEPAAEQVA